MLVSSIAQLPYHRILMETERCFTPEQQQDWDNAAARLLKGEPLQYIIGKADFAGLELHVEPGVLIPRPETEELVEWIASEMREMDRPSALDVGTGSGCIPIYLKLQAPTARIYAVDLSERALRIAQMNATIYKVSIGFEKLDILKANGSEFAGLQVLVSNPPYIPQAEQNEMAPHVLAHEPGEALFVPDDNPLIFYEKIAQLGFSYLAPGGKLFLEVHEEQGEAVLELLKQKGYTLAELRQDLQAKPRMIRAQKPL